MPKADVKEAIQEFKQSIPVVRVNVVAALCLLLPPLVGWLLISGPPNVYLSFGKNERLLVIGGSLLLGVLLALSPKIAKQ